MMINKDRKSEYWLALGVLIIVATVMLAASLPVARLVTFEYTDYAANSLLVLDAKNLSLLKGNYSRVGFNHPGPAFLYVMALGEVLFYETLGLVRYPFGGQILGVTLLNAGWITLIWLLLRRINNSTGAAFVGLAAFIGVCTLNNPGFLFGIWMPFLYVCPFAVFTLAIAQVATGRLDSLVPLAVTWGFLFHGHAAFMIITAVMLILALAAHVGAAYWLPQNEWPRLLSLEAFREHQSKIFIAAAIVATALLPPLIETILHFPGPFSQYFGYGGSRSSNSLSASVHYVLANWGGLGFLLAAVLSVCLMLVVHRNDQQKTSQQIGILIAFSVATVSVLLYTIFGIDYLDQPYIVYFYKSVPALLAAACTIAIYSVIARVQWRIGSAVLAAITSVALLAFTERRVPENDSSIRVAYESLRQFAPGPAVLELSQSEDWHRVWAYTLGLLAYSKRDGTVPYCIGAHWDVSFTTELRCHDQIDPETTRLKVSAIQVGAAEPTDSILRILGLDITPAIKLVLDRGNSFRVDQDRIAFDSILQHGWSAIEQEFVWSIGNEAEVLLNFRNTEPRQVIFDLSAFLPKDGSEQKLRVLLNGKSQKELTFSRSADRIQVAVDLGEATSVSRIRFEILQPISPKQVGMSGDDRKLGIALWGFKIN